MTDGETRKYNCDFLIQNGLMAVIRKALMNSFLSLMSINIRYILKHHLNILDEKYILKWRTK